VIIDRSIDAAFDLMRALRTVEAPPVPDQSALDAILAELSPAAGASCMSD
jgi:hypothetical protein